MAVLGIHPGDSVSLRAGVNLCLNRSDSSHVTLTLHHAGRELLLSPATLRAADDITDAADLTSGWTPATANPDIMWISGNFVEADNPNSNRQFWTAADLELAEYSIKFSPLNIAHRYRHPVGFFADTRTVKLERAAEGGSLKIQALAGMWAHIFPEQAALVTAADAAGELFYSMECTGSHLICAGDSGCGQKFKYQDSASHCEHLTNRTSVRHIVNPTFRGGALIIPPVKPGWQNATATVLSAEALREAARWVDVNADGLADAASHMSAREWETVMAMTIQTSVQSSGR